MRRNMKFAWVAIAALALVPAMVLGQTSAGNIAGKVMDQKNAVLPGVTVTATNSDTGYKLSATTDEAGSFKLASVPVGTYTVVAELSGFSTVTVDKVKVDVASTRTLEVTMAQAAVQETITVVDE